VWLRASLLAMAVAISALSGASGQPSPGDPSQDITFSDACEAGQRLIIATVGDLLFHRPLEEEALRPGHSYKQFWEGVSGVLAKADLGYGNLEGTVADGVAFGGRLVTDAGRRAGNSVYGAPDWTVNFNYHPSLLDDLVASGFKIVSTANNHALDRGLIGIDRTIANLRRAGLAFSGTRSSDDSTGGFSAVTRVNGLAIAWLSCTALTNRPREQGNQVLRCYDQRAEVLGEIRRLSADPAIDAVVFTPHWGIEEDSQPENRQRELAHQAVEAGAILVVGSHPHVLQLWEKLTAADGREALVIYSNGNFISGMTGAEQRRGDIALIEIVKTGDRAKARLAAAGYVATWVEVGPDHRLVEDTSERPSVLPEGNRIFARDLAKWPEGCSELGSGLR
jgi:poly-gamma-glutamate capsule biosynthesis protein CapA/YwtB (metallophosphatase superfamily)